MFTQKDRDAISYAHVLMTFDMDRARQCAKNATNDDDRFRILQDAADLWIDWMQVQKKILDNPV